MFLYIFTIVACVIYTKFGFLVRREETRFLSNYAYFVLKKMYIFHFKAGVFIFQFEFIKLGISHET